MLNSSQFFICFGFTHNPCKHGYINTVFLLHSSYDFSQQTDEMDSLLEELLMGDTAMDDAAEGTPPAQCCKTFL